MTTQKNLLWKVDHETLFIENGEITILDDEVRNEKKILLKCYFLKKNHIFLYLDQVEDLIEQDKQLRRLNNYLNRYRMDYNWKYNSDSNTWSMKPFDEEIIIKDEEDVNFLNKLSMSDDYIYVNDIPVDYDFEEFFEMCDRYVDILDKYIKVPFYYLNEPIIISRG